MQDRQNTEYRWETERILNYPKGNLIPKEGEKVVEVERLKPISATKTIVDYYILDFGQNLTGYVGSAE